MIIEILKWVGWLLFVVFCCTWWFILPISIMETEMWIERRKAKHIAEMKEWRVYEEYLGL